MPDCIRFAYALSRGGATALSGEAAIAQALADPEPAWIHMDFGHPDTETWIDTHLHYLPRTVREALLADETRPRAQVVGDGVLVILRGVNLNPGEEPEDMVAVRLWVEAGRVISVGRRPLSSLAELAREVGDGAGPDRSGALLTALVDRISERMDEYVARLDTEGDALEETVLRAPDRALRARLTDIRGEVVDVRRFLLPQRDAVARLSNARVDVLAEDDRLQLTEAHEGLLRALEEVEGLRDRMVVVADELSTALSDRLNRNLYMLSMISAIFLPLGVLTGLMGINVAGLPGEEWEPAFWVFSAILGGIVILQVLLLRALRWL